MIKKFLFNRKVKREGGEAFSSTLRKFYLNKYNIAIGYGTYGGCFDIRYIPPNVSFGNYCSIAAGVKIFRANHPTSYFTSHPLFYNPVMGFVEEDLLNRPSLKIGHDVWIGADVIILPSVKEIGNGSVIGAGSVVVKDIPPYAIFAGNPAREIRMRFKKEQIDKLEKSKWWECTKSELIQKKDIFEKIVR